MKRLMRFSVYVLLVCVFWVAAAQSQEREKPRLIDFGASLRPGYSKPKPADEQSKISNSDDGEIIRVDTNLVVSDVLVMDEKGFAVNNLTKADFIINEDGVAQTTETFAQGDTSEVGRSIVLVMDYSGSLRPYIKTSVAAAKVLVDKLNPKDRMAIVTDDVELLADFTRDKTLLKSKLDELEAYTRGRKFGRSQQFSALFASLNELFDVEDIRSILIFQTDGDELPYLRGNAQLRDPGLASLKNLPPSTQALIRERNFSYQDIVTAAEKARATIYSVIPGRRFIGLTPDEVMAQARLREDEEVRFFESSMRRPLSPEAIEKGVQRYAFIMPRIHSSVASIAADSGGRTKYLETPEAADNIYTEILTDLNNRYLVGYYPTNQTHDGKRRTLKIEVRDHPEYRIYTRRSYYAPESR